MLLDKSWFWPFYWPIELYAIHPGFSWHVSVKCEWSNCISFPGNSHASLMTISLVNWFLKGFEEIWLPLKLWKVHYVIGKIWFVKFFLQQVCIYIWIPFPHPPIETSGHWSSHHGIRLHLISQSPASPSTITPTQWALVIAWVQSPSTKSFTPSTAESRYGRSNDMMLMNGQMLAFQYLLHVGLVYYWGPNNHSSQLYIS